MMVNDKDKIFINMTVMNMMPIVRLLVMGNNENVNVNGQ